MIVLFGHIFSIHVVSHHKLTFKLNIAVCKEGIALDENSKVFVSVLPGSTYWIFYIIFLIATGKSTFLGQSQPVPYADKMQRVFLSHWKVMFQVTKKRPQEIKKMWVSFSSPEFPHTSYFGVEDSLIWLTLGCIYYSAPGPEFIILYGVAPKFL